MTTTNRPNKPILNNIHGILLLNKPLQATSNGALQRVKRLFSAKKAGHTGSLDPLATGMLPICFGEATKICQYLLESDKYYSVTAQLGSRTTTGDAEGEVIETLPIPNFTRESLEKVCEQFKGVIEQIPPMFSAIKHQGQPLYKLARNGIEVERKPRAVTIHELELSEITETTFDIDVHCTKGTYIRTLVEDIGNVMGCGAYVSRLHRSAVAPYQQSPMYTFEQLEAIRDEEGLPGLRRLLLPLESSVQTFPAVKLSTSAAFYIKLGQPVMAPHELSKGLIRLFSDNGQFIGIGEMLDDGRVTPRRLLDYSKDVA